METRCPACELLRNKIKHLEEEIERWRSVNNQLKEDNKLLSSHRDMLTQQLEKALKTP